MILSFAHVILLYELLGICGFGKYTHGRIVSPIQKMAFRASRLPFLKGGLCILRTSTLNIRYQLGILDLIEKSNTTVGTLPPKKAPRFGGAQNM